MWLVFWPTNSCSSNYFFQSKYYSSKVYETISHKSKVSYLKCLLYLCRYDAALIENGIHYAATATAQRSSKMTASLNKYYNFLIHLIYLTIIFFNDEQSWSFRKGELILSQETPKTNTDCQNWRVCIVSPKLRTTFFSRPELKFLTKWWKSFYKNYKVIINSVTRRGETIKKHS